MNAPAATHEPRSIPDFRERLMALAGGTAFRDGTPSTRSDNLPVAHAVAAQLAFARRGREDVGIDVAVAAALGSDYKRAVIVSLLANALAVDRHPLTRRNLKALGYIANCAFDIVVHGRHRGRLSTVSADDWALLVPAACRILEALADAAVAEAERLWRRK